VEVRGPTCHPSKSERMIARGGKELDRVQTTCVCVSMIVLRCFPAVTIGASHA
jgi:hypothetical protein